MAQLVKLRLQIKKLTCIQYHAFIIPVLDRLETDRLLELSVQPPLPNQWVQIKGPVSKIKVDDNWGEKTPKIVPFLALTALLQSVHICISVDTNQSMSLLNKKPTKNQILRLSKDYWKYQILCISDSHSLRVNLRLVARDNAQMSCGGWKGASHPWHVR